jgi:hypothetical protein
MDDTGDTDDIDRSNSNDPEDRKMEHRLVYHVMPDLVEWLLLSNKLDKSRVDDLDYVWSVIDEHLDLAEFVHSSSRIDHEIIESARDAAKLGRFAVVVILIATALEHSINLFYRDILQKRFPMSIEDTTEAIKSNLSVKLVGCYGLSPIEGYQKSFPNG